MQNKRMQTMTRYVKLCTLIALFVGVGSAAVHAQGFGGPPPGRPGGGPPQPPVSAASVPVSVMTAELALSSSQEAKIQTIQTTFQDARRALAPPPPRPEDGQDMGTPPTPPAPPGDATRARIKALEEDATQQIEAVLTDTQKTALASLVQTLRALQAAGISPRAYEQMALTAEQKTQIVSAVDAQRADEKAAIEKSGGDPDAVQSILGDARRKTHDAVMAILTDTQKAIAAKSGRGPRGGPGGQGPGSRPQDGQGPPPDGQGPPPDGQGPPPPDGQ